MAGPNVSETTHAIDGFVDVLVEATGQVERVPADWLGHPVLGVGIQETVAQLVADGEVSPDVLVDPPTERDTHEVIDAFAADAHIDLGEASTKAEKLAVIAEALAAAPQAEAAPAEPAPTDPDVQLVAGTEGDLPIIPSAAETVKAARATAGEQDTTSTDGTESSDENPDAGDKEN